MRRTVLTLVAALMLAVATLMTATVAFAGWDWEDCPPASAAGFANASTTAAEHWVEPPPPSAPQSRVANPGNKN